MFFTEKLTSGSSAWQEVCRQIVVDDDLPSAQLINHCMNAGIDGLQRRFHIAEKCPPVLIEGHSSAVPVKQGRTELLLQAKNYTAQCRLGDKQFLGRPGDVLTPGHRHKIVELIEFHKIPPSNDHILLCGIF